jgi:Ni/Fe-hydrogenase subunit HybB-like protein
MGAREKNLTFIRVAAVWAVLGIVLNRLNVSLIAFNWHLPADERYFPSIPEIGTTVFIVTLGVVVYRFIATRMPILHEHPEYKQAH